MRAVIRLAAVALVLTGLGFGSASAQGAAPPPWRRPLHRHRTGQLRPPFFGSVSRGLAQVIEKAVSQWGLPNGYVLGEDAGGAFVAGLRYGDGVLYTKNAGDLKVYWQGPSVGWDFGGDGARTMMLVYNLPATEAIYERFGGVDGSAYFVGRVRHDRADQRQRGGGSDPLRRRAAPRRQRRLSEIHPQADLEPALRRASTAACRFRLPLG